MSASETIALLTEIRDGIRALVAAQRGGGPGASGGDVASDADLDSQYGDPEVRRDPKDWTGETCAGRHYSECPPEFLDMLAGFHDWRAGKCEQEGEAKKASYARKDAARARGWAARIRARGPAAKPRPSPAAASFDGGAVDDFGGEADIPF